MKADEKMILKLQRTEQKKNDGNVFKQPEFFFS